MSDLEDSAHTRATVLHLIFLSMFLGMQIWYTFFSSFVLSSCLNRHMYGYVQSELLPFYLHTGSVCSFANFTIFAVLHPHIQADDRETFQIFIFFVSVMIGAVNSHYFGAMTAETMADMHRIERFCSVDKSILLSTSMEAYDKLCESHSEYRKLGYQLWWYHWLSSFCNLCCIICNGFSVFYMTQNLHILGL